MRPSLWGETPAVTPERLGGGAASCIRPALVAGWRDHERAQPENRIHLVALRLGAAKAFVYSIKTHSAAAMPAGSDAFFVPFRSVAVFQTKERP